MSTQKLKSDLIHLHKVNVLGEKLETSTEFRDHQEKVAGTRFHFGLEMANNLERGLTRIRLFISLEGMDKQKEPAGVSGTYELEFHFEVENFSDFLRTDKDGHPLIDALLGATLVGIAFSTARGIIFERTKGTFLNGVLLPVIDPHGLLMESQKIPKVNAEVAPKAVGKRRKIASTANE